MAENIPLTGIKPMFTVSIHFQGKLLSLSGAIPRNRAVI